MNRSKSWKAAGRVYVWRYTERTRNFFGWHLTADAVGCMSLIALIDAMTSDGAPVTRVFDVSAPTDRILAVPNNRDAAWVAPTRLRLTFTDTESTWAFSETLDPAEISLGADWMPALREGIEAVAQNRGDYAIGSREGGNLPLWFWWQPRSA